MTNLSCPIVTGALVAILTVPGPARAQSSTVTYTRDVAPILNSKCVSCHRPGEAAPMPLRTFDEVRPFARAIRTNVSARVMPPWPIDRSVGHFANDPSLTDAQISTIVRWVDGGTVQGDPKDLPPAPMFTTGWQLGEPDLIIELPEIKIPASGEDVFPIPRTTVTLDRDRWIRAVEVRPGNTAVAHHAVLFSGTGVFAAGGDVLATWSVGTAPNVYPEGMGRWLRNGQTITANMHYHPNGTAATDRTRIGFYFGKGELRKEISTALAADPTFSIPPGATNFEVRGVYVAEQDITLVSLFPHMHLRGKDMKMTASFPDGRREVLLNVPEYAYNWQFFYYPRAPLDIPRGTRIDVVAHFDNSSANRRNPDPSKAVRFGETTNEEMMLGGFEFVARDGISPRRPNDRARTAVIMSTFPADSSWVLSGPTVFGAIPSGLYLPRSGDGVWYIRGPLGVMFSVPVQHIAWEGNNFKFGAEVKALNMGGTLDVSGSVRDDGSITGTIQMTGSGLVPFRSFVGTRPGASPATDEGGALTTNAVDGQHYAWISPGGTMAQGFWIGQTEVMQSAYEKVMHANPSTLKGEFFPVDGVSEANAAAFCRTVGGRLPTRAEWDYARASPGATDQATLDRAAWTAANSDGHTHQVATRLPNRWGLSDMVGNVAEWTTDGGLRGDLSFAGPAADDTAHAGFRCVIP